MKKPKLLDVIVLLRDLPEFRLPARGVGTVVEVFGDEAYMVEFFDREGGTVALLTVSPEDVRVATKEEIERAPRPQPLPPGVEVPIADAISRQPSR